MKLYQIVLVGAAMFAATSVNAQSLNNSGADGFVNTTASPGNFTLVGGDNGSGGYGSTTYTMTALSDMTISGMFNYSTVDYGIFDTAGYQIGGDQYQLSVDDGYANSGTFSFSVVAGQDYGFYVNTLDNIGGRGRIAITSNAFSAPMAAAVPEPATWALMILGVGAVGFAMRRRNSPRTNVAVRFA